jgi:hypothetical protein
LTGAYSLELPLASPLVAPYTTGPLVFTGDAAAASKYLVIATPVGFAAKSTAVILQPGTVTLLDFTFP